jgi:transposase
VYRRNRVKQQRFYVRTGNPVLEPEEVQARAIDELRLRLFTLYERGVEVVQVDEACFSTKKNDRRHWAPAGNPIEIREKWTSLPQIKVCGAISEQSGLSITRYSRAAFTHEDMVAFLEALRGYYGPTKQLAVFWDNASYHRSPAVLKAARKMGIELVRNIPYRPDFNGIEILWRKAKSTYYKFVDSMRAMGRREWDQHELVRRCVEEVPVDMVQRMALGGWHRLNSGLPISRAARPWERGSSLGLAMTQVWLTGIELAQNYLEARRRQVGPDEPEDDDAEDE